MPYPCCCRQTNNGAYCFVCGTRTPAQWALTWPEVAIQYRLNNVLTDIWRMPGGTHILSQTPGDSCCWNGPAFRICTNTQNVDRIARLFVWRYTAINNINYLTANWTFQPATITPTSQCGVLNGNNQVGRVTFTQSSLAGCRSGPYTTSVAAQDAVPLSAAGWCSQSPFLSFTQVAGSVVLQDVST